jgi:hypothetical protein
VLFFFFFFFAYGGLGGKVTLGGLNRWFIPRGQDLAFLLSCIGLLGLRAAFDLKQNKTKPQVARLRVDSDKKSRYIMTPRHLFVQMSTE